MFPLFPLIKCTLERLSNLPNVTPVVSDVRRTFQVISCQISCFVFVLQYKMMFSRGFLAVVLLLVSPYKYS